MHLIHINVLWGRGAAENVDGQAVVNTANLLRTHFLKKRYKKKSLAVNSKLSADSTLVFRGRDKKDRMIIVVLTTAPVPEGANNKESLNKEVFTICKSGKRSEQASRILSKFKIQSRSIEGGIEKVKKI